MVCLFAMNEINLINLCVVNCMVATEQSVEIASKHKHIIVFQIRVLKSSKFTDPTKGFNFCKQFVCLIDLAV